MEKNDLFAPIIQEKPVEQAQAVQTLPAFHGVVEEVNASGSLFQPEENVSSQSKLSGAFCFWHRYGDNTPYSDTRKLADFQTVEQFWCYYDHIKRMADLHESTDLHLFRSTSCPMWEDSTNSNGARLIMRATGHIFARYWEEILLNFIGEQFYPLQDEINGFSLNIRPNKSSSIAIWIRNSQAETEIDSLIQKLQTLLALPQFCSIEVKLHQKEDGGHERTYKNNSSGRGGRFRQRDNQHRDNNYYHQPQHQSQPHQSHDDNTSAGRGGGEKKNWKRAKPKI